MVRNIQRDRVELAEHIKILCQHIRPEAYFKQEKADAISTDFVESIRQQLGRDLTPEEKIALNIVEVDDEEDVDIIERA